LSTSGSTICAIAGGSGAGKTTLATLLMDLIGDECDHLAIDWYYRDLRHLTPEQRSAVNYDHPDSLEVELYATHLEQLRSGQAIDAPVYDFATHTRSPQVQPVASRSVVVTEGILLLAIPEAVPLFDLKVFIDVSAELRLDRRLRRDQAERGRDPDDIRRQWNEFVAPMHDQLVEPSKAAADRIVAEDEDLAVVAAELAERLSA